MKSVIVVVGIIVFNVVFTLLSLVTFRFFGEARNISSAAMEPTFSQGDRILVEKISNHLRRPYLRGEIVLFYPPAEEMGKELSWEPGNVMGRLTGLAAFPNDPVFLSRIIGLPGEAIQVVNGQGVFVNGKLLKEKDYESPRYDLNYLRDIGGLNQPGTLIRPYGVDATDSIVVPPGHLFVLGDNRNLSEDSHVWGMLNYDRVIGRVQVKFWPEIKTFEPYKDY